MDEDSRNRVAVVNRAALKALGYTQCEGAMLVDERMKRNVPDFPDPAPRTADFPLH